jgi:hypothetical protein
MIIIIIIIIIITIIIITIIMIIITTPSLDPLYVIFNIGLYYKKLKVHLSLEKGKCTDVCEAVMNSFYFKIKANNTRF